MILILVIITVGFLGITLGGNDAGNVFGTAVATRFISFRKAGILSFACIVLGATLQGHKGIETLSNITTQSVYTSIMIGWVVSIVSLVLTLLGLPISLSQSIIGALLGLGLAQRDVEWDLLKKVVICWLATPIGAGVIAILIYKLLLVGLSRVRIGILTRETIIRYGLIAVGMGGSYALGANNVANTVGIFPNTVQEISNVRLAMLGGISIGLGVILLSKPVMMKLGREIVALDGFSAFVAVLSSSISVYIFALIGVPVSTTQAIVGAIIGIGIHHGVHTLHFRVIRDILLSWFLAPLLCLILTSSFYAIFIQGR